jgi:hypothetical protein
MDLDTALFLLYECKPPGREAGRAVEGNQYWCIGSVAYDRKSRLMINDAAI